MCRMAAKCLVGVLAIIAAGTHAQQVATLGDLADLTAEGVSLRTNADRAEALRDRDNAGRKTKPVAAAPTMQQASHPVFIKAPTTPPPPPPPPVTPLAPVGGAK